MSIFSTGKGRSAGDGGALTAFPGKINLERMVSAPHIQALPSEQTLITPPHQNGSVVKAPASERSHVPGIVSISLAIFSLAGIALAFRLRTIPAGNADPRLFFNVFYFLFARNEVAGLTIVAVFFLLAAFFFFRKRSELSCGEERSQGASLKACGLVALLVLIFTTLGSQWVFHDYLLTADEHLADFQARIYLRGQLQAGVPETWRSVVRVIRPTFVDYSPANHSWNATYLPVYAAMRAVFQSVHLQALLNPLMAAVTLLALYGTAKNVWPESKTNAFVAVLLLASSAQFLLMAMTGYSMPAHLALNTVWLWLYSRPDCRRFYLAPIVGAFAIGLHQPIVHALFVLPFLARLVWQRRWFHTFIFAAVYFVACAGWYAWKMHFMPPPMPGAPHEQMFRFWNPRMLVIQPMNLLLVIGWTSLATPLLAVLGFARFFKERPFLQDAMLSCLLTFGFYYFFYLDQAHGWGYRYFHGTLCCMVLAAIAGLQSLSGWIGERRARAFIYAGVAMSILVQLPLRCFQAEGFVRPYARAAAVIHSMPQQIVGIDPRDGWYIADLIRNDPFLEQRPVIVALYQFTPTEIASLESKGTARFITRDEFSRLGLSTQQRYDYAPDRLRLGFH